MSASTSHPTARRALRATAVAVAALLATACAGSLEQYRNGLPGPGGATVGAPTETAMADVGAAPAGTGAATGQPTISAPGVAAPAVSGVLSVAPRTSVTQSGVGTGTAPGGTATVAPASTAAGQQGSGPAAGVAAPGGNSGTGGTPATVPGPGGAAPTPIGPGTTTGVTKDTVNVGLFYPKTGAYTGLARNAAKVMEAAFAEAGAIHGRRLVVKTYDDGTANASTIQVEEKRAKDESFGLMSVVSESNVVLAPLADQHKVPVIIGNIDQKVALPLTYAFALITFIEHQATLPGFIRNVLGGASKRIGVVYEGTSTVKNAKEAFKAKAAEAGMHVVFEQPIAQNQSTCANEVSNLQAKQVELVVMINGPLGGICMLRDAGALNYHPIWTGVGPSWNLNVVAAASGGEADGIRALTSMTTLETPAGRHYVEVMRKYAPNTGAEDDDIMLIVYSLAQTFIEALRRTGPDLSREAFVQTMETKMNGYDSGYLPPPSFGPGNRSGPRLVGVNACCSNGRWTTPQIGWRPDF